MRPLELWRRLNPRDTRALKLVFLVLLFAGSHSFLIRPAAGATRRLWEEVRRERDLLERETDLIGQRELLESQLGRGRSAIATAARILFQGPDAVTAAADLTSYVTGLAADYGVIVQESEPESDSGESDRLVRISVSVRAASDLLALTEWLDALERGRKLVRVRAISLAPAGAIMGGSTADLLAIGVVIEGFGMTREVQAELAGASQ